MALNFESLEQTIFSFYGALRIHKRSYCKQVLQMSIESSTSVCGM